MSKEIIAVDIDDVLADSMAFWIEKVNKMTGADLNAEHYNVPGEYWSYYENVWKTHKIDHLVSMPEIVSQISKDQSQIKMYADSLEVLTGLTDRFDLVVVTARDSTHVKETNGWLDQNYPNIFSNAVFAGGSSGLANKNKGAICKEIGATWLVDDNPGHCQDAINEGVGAVLFGEYGWHQNIPKGVVQCKGWIAVREYFDARS